MRTLLVTVLYFGLVGLAVAQSVGGMSGVLNLASGGSGGGGGGGCTNGQLDFTNTCNTVFAGH